MLKTQRLLKTTLLYTSVVTAIASPALATQVPSSADPGRLDKRYQGPASPKKTIAPVTAKPSAPADSAVMKKSVRLTGVNITGMTVYNQADFASLYSDMIGKTVTFGDVQGVANAITKKYQSDGYILSSASVSPSSTNDGVADIRVIEGGLNNVVLEGDVGSSWRTTVQQYGQKLVAEKPLNAATLERYLLLINDLPGNAARGIIRPITTGGADLIIQAQHKDWDFSINENNRGTKYLGPWQTTGTVTANSIFGAHERTLFRTLVTSPVNELQFYSLNHEEIIGAEGTRLELQGSYADSRPRHTLAALDIDGASTNLQAKLHHPFIRTRTENLNGRVTFDVRNSKTDLLDHTSNLNKDRVRSVRLGGSYDTTDRWDGVNIIDAELSHGLDILNATEDNNGVTPAADFARTRVNGEHTYTKITADISRTQSLPMNFSVLTQVNGQYAFDSLLASEQFVLGSTPFGSAYDPGELTGDHGLTGKVEVRWGDQPGLQFLDSYQLYGYYDVGSVWLREPLATEQSRMSLASTGLGVRFNATQWLSGSAEVGFPLTKDVAVEGDRDPRLFVSLTARY